MDYQFSTHDLVCLGLCSTVGVWYIMKKHWLANDLLGMAFAINGVELLHLNNVVTGCILLGGLFFYDIFWVFGTDVMVTVAKSFEAPIKLVFPQVGKVKYTVLKCWIKLQFSIKLRDLIFHYTFIRISLRMA